MTFKSFVLSHKYIFKQWKIGRISSQICLGFLNIDATIRRCRRIQCFLYVGFFKTLLFLHNLTPTHVPFQLFSNPKKSWACIMVHLRTSHSAVTLQCQHCNVIVFTLHCLRDHERIKHHSKSCQHWPVTSTENTITANTSLSPNYRLSWSTRVTRALGGQLPLRKWSIMQFRLSWQSFTLQWPSKKVVVEGKGGKDRNIFHMHASLVVVEVSQS